MERTEGTTFIIEGNTMSMFNLETQSWERCEDQFFGSENPQDYVSDLEALKLSFIEMGWMIEANTIEVRGN